MDAYGAVKLVTAAGTPVQLSATSKPFNELLIQPMSDLSALGTAPVFNVGYIYLKRTSTAKGTGSTDIVMAIPNTSTGVTLRAQSRNGDDLMQYWLDADNSGDGALLAYS